MKRRNKVQETYKYIRKLGEGAFGEAILVQSNGPNKNYYVMKSISLINMNEEKKKKKYEEVKILKKLNHPNIIKFHEGFIVPNPSPALNIIVEYADGGDLSMKIKNQKKKNRYFEESQILDWFIQICLALHHMHKKHILHRDIKAQNIFLTINNIIKIGDFGISKSLDNTLEKARTVIGTPYYISPEIIQNIPYSYKSDIWSLGVLLYEMVSLKVPFDGPNLPILILKIQKGEYEQLKNIWSEDLRNLIYSMLQTNPNNRPNLEDILSKFYCFYNVFFRNAIFKGKNEKIVRRMWLQSRFY